MARSISRFIKDMDIFGMPIPLNFDKKGSKHKTCSGFLATLLFVIACIFIIRENTLSQDLTKSVLFLDPENSPNDTPSGEKLQFYL